MSREIAPTSERPLRSKRPMNLALIGLGMASKPHLAALDQLREVVNVAGVHSRAPERREQIAAQFGWPVYDSVEAICADASVDGALVITPPNARMEIVMALAQAGKHVLMEKPIERTLDAARQIVEICENANVSLGIVLQHRFRAGAEALSALVQSGVLGAIHMARVSVPWWREQSYYEHRGRGRYDTDGGGVLITQAIHILDLTLSLVGPVKAVSALTGTTPLHQLEAEDFAAAGLIFQSGALGSLVATTASFPGATETLALETENAGVMLTGGELVVHWRDGRRETIGEMTNTGGGGDPMDFPCDWHRELIKDFAASWREDRAPRITGREALKVHELIDAIERSARSGRREPAQK